MIEMMREKHRIAPREFIEVLMLLALIVVSMGVPAGLTLAVIAPNGFAGVVLMVVSGAVSWALVAGLAYLYRDRPGR